MKILLSLYACNPNVGSEEGSGWNTLVHYAQAGFEVWAITRANNREPIEKKLASLKIHNVRMHYVALRKWQTALCKAKEAGMYLDYFWWQQKAARKARNLDKKENFAFVHHITYGSLQQGTGMWRLRKPLIYGPVGGGQFTPDVFKKYFGKDWFKYEIVRRWISRLLVQQDNVRRTLREAALVYTSNQETLQMAEKLGGKNVVQFHDSGLPSEFYPEDYPARPVRDKLRLLWVGRMFSRKGLPLVLEALAEVDKSVDFHLTIVGYGPLADQIPGWVKEYGLQGKVTCTGRVPWIEMRKVYHQHDAFMFCSLRDSGAMQYMEAMAWGLPVVTLDMHGGRVTVSDSAGIKVPVGNRTLDAIISDLARAVEKLYREPYLLEQKSRAAYEHARQYSWENRMASHYAHVGRMLGVDCVPGWNKTPVPALENLLAENLPAEESVKEAG